MKITREQKIYDFKKGILISVGTAALLYCATSVFRYSVNNINEDHNRDIDKRLTSIEIQIAKDGTAIQDIHDLLQKLVH